MAPRTDEEDDDDAAAARGDAQRLDKWLWFARVIKSRTQAAELVTDGKVRVNAQRVTKPSQAVKPGDVVTVTIRGHVRVLRMLLPGSRRGPPAEAQLLYEEVQHIAPSGRTSKMPMNALSGPLNTPGSGRPTKKQRRQLDRLRDRED